MTYETKLHPGRDGGVRSSGPEMLALLKNQFRHGLLMLDWEGSGSDAGSSLELEKQLTARLSPLWGNQTGAIVIDPELESRIWGSDNAMMQVLEWTEDGPVRAWLIGRGYHFDTNQKPSRPKEALEELMRYLSKPRSSVYYEKMTSKISLARCVDPAFNRLKAILQSWFPP